MPPDSLLAGRYRADGPLEVGHTALVGVSVVDALVATHQAGVVHRDVTPRNVLIGRDGRVMLTDFGLALWHHGDEPGEPVAMGTAQYVAPERITGGESTPAGDMWSLGATLYTAVEGRPPYARPSVTEALSAAVTQAPDALSRAGALAPLLCGLLEREPRLRPTAARARRMLEGVAAATASVGTGPLAAAAQAGQ
jgi:eukaryotic-like serine/threonine-protein kinase